jgi:transposase
MVLSAQSAGQQRLLLLQRAVAIGDQAGEVTRLQEENRRLKAENRMLRARFGDAPSRKRYTPIQRLQILWHMTYYGIPRSKVAEHFLIARSTFYRWLHAAERGDVGEKKTPTESTRRTPTELAQMIWDMFEANPHFGRHRIANTVWLLGIFVAASTVRNVLVQAKPRKVPAPAKAQDAPAAPREIIARYPNHVWSVDRTRVLRWGLWPTWVLVAIDHFSRAVMAVVPLEGPNAGWVVEAMEEAFVQYGAPRHLISDQEGVFISDAFQDLLIRWDVKQRFGAVGKHGSIAVVCDCRATVNAVEAEGAILDLLEPLFCDPAVLTKLEAAVRKRFVAVSRQRSESKSLEGQLTAELAEVEGQIGRLVQWIAKGRLVEDLETQMGAAEARRDHLRQELARARAAEPPTGIDVLPTAVRKIVSDLRAMLQAGQVENLKRILSRLVTTIEVHEDPRPGRKRPGAKLVVRGSLEALLQMTGKVTTGNSPGGILPLLTFPLPPRAVRLQSHRVALGVVGAA